jgi:sec-independent protein translocase protein TatB
MFDIGFGEVLLLLAAGLIVVGPDRLPQFAAQAARVLRQLRGQINDAKSSITDAVSIDAETLQDLRDLDPRRLLATEPQPRKTEKSVVDPDTT